MYAGRPTINLKLLPLGSAIRVAGRELGCGQVAALGVEAAEVAADVGVLERPRRRRDLGCHGARYVWYARGWYAYLPRTYSTRGPGGKPPCASGTYPTREAGTRGPYVPYGGPGAYASAQVATRGQGAGSSSRQSATMYLVR